MPLTSKGERQTVNYLENEETTKSLFAYFLQNTSLPGVHQIFHRKTVLLRLFWSCLFVVGVAISCYQATELITSYKRYDVSERGYYRVKQQLTFPSVSICSNQPFNWIASSKNKNPHALSINKTIEEELGKLKQERNMSLQDVMKEGSKILMRELAKLTYDQRLSLGYQRKEFIVTCSFDEEECSESDILKFNNLYYGNCFTFNPGFNGSVEAKSHDSYLHMIVSQDFEGHFPYQDKFIGPMLIIHPYGEPPIFNIQKSFWIYPGFWTTFNLEEIMFIRLPEPYISKCVPPDDPQLRKKNLFYSQRTPYNYSMAACFETCGRDMEIEKCQCVHPRHISHNKTWSLPICDTVCPPDSSKRKTDCKCSQPCLERKYEIHYKMEPGSLSFLRYKQNLDQIRHFIPNSTTKSADEILKEFTTKYIGIEVNFRSPLIHIIEEHPEQTIADLWGAIGGNLGLLIGISVLSFMEIFELFIIYAVRKFESTTRVLRHYKHSTPSTKRSPCTRPIQVRPMAPYFVYIPNSRRQERTIYLK